MLGIRHVCQSGKMSSLQRSVIWVSKVASRKDRRHQTALDFVTICTFLKISVNGLYCFITVFRKFEVTWGKGVNCWLEKDALHRD